MLRSEAWNADTLISALALGSRWASEALVLELAVHQHLSTQAAPVIEVTDLQTAVVLTGWCAISEPFVPLVPLVVDSSDWRYKLGRPFCKLTLYTHWTRFREHLSHTPPLRLFPRVHRNFCL